MHKSKPLNSYRASCRRSTAIERAIGKMLKFTPDKTGWVSSFADLIVVTCD